MCGQSPIHKWIRIILSLVIIGLGIYLKSWFGLIGVLSMISAFIGAGTCKVPDQKESSRFKL